MEVPEKPKRKMKTGEAGSTEVKDKEDLETQRTPSKIKTENTKMKVEEIDLESCIKTECKANIVKIENKEDIIKADDESKIKSDTFVIKEEEVDEGKIKDDISEQIKTEVVVKKEMSLKKEYLRPPKEENSTFKDELNVFEQVAGKGRVKSHKTIIRKSTSRKRFSPEEEQVLLNAIEAGGKINIRQLAEDLQRTYKSMEMEVMRLKNGKEQRKKRRRFTLPEDKIILDAVLINLGEESLEDVNLTRNEWIEVGKLIGKANNSARGRWTFNLRPWILQHFAGTLNLEIKRPLTNYLAENFTDLNSIDWAMVTEKPEFAGNTYSSLRNKFGKVLKLAKENLQKKGEDITLKMIAEFANTKYAAGERKVLDRDVKRQQDIIDYFECHVKSSGIKDLF